MIRKTAPPPARIYASRFPCRHRAPTCSEWSATGLWPGRDVARRCPNPRRSGQQRLAGSDLTKPERENWVDRVGCTFEVGGKTMARPERIIRKMAYDAGQQERTIQKSLQDR